MNTQILIAKEDIDNLAQAIVTRLLAAQQLPALMTGPQVDAFLKISRTTRYRMEKVGDLQRTTVWGRVHYKREDVLRILNK